MRVNNYVLVVLTALVGVVMLCLGVRGSLDMRPYYSFQEASNYFNHLSVEMSYAYLIKEFLDLGLIALYSGLFKRGVRKFIFPNPPKLFIFLIPGFFDLIETVSIILILKNLISHSILGILGVISLLKWTSGATLFALISYKWIKSKNMPSGEGIN